MIDARNRGDGSGPTREAPDARPPGSGAMAWRLGLSWAALLLERAWREAWAPVAVTALFLAVAVSGALPLLGGWAHGAVLAGFALAFLLLLVRALRRIAPPTAADARRRLERVNHLDDRPLETLADRPSDPSPQALALWRRHRRRAAARIAALRVGAPSPRVADRDPRALRLVAFVALGGAFLASGSQGGARFLQALSPAFSDPAAVARVAVDAWIAPPDYTGLAPIFLDRDGVRERRDGDAANGARQAEAAANGPAAEPETIAAPVGSRLSIQVATPPEEPVLTAPDGTSVSFERFGPDARRLETAITTGGLYRLEIAGRTVARWRVAAVPDQPPVIEMPESPRATPQLSLRISYAARDDYGVEKARARLTRVDGPQDDAEAITLDLPAPGAARNGDALSSYRDLTAHPWAGGEVRMVLQAEDAIGQTGESEPLTLTLPQRVFQHPVARAIVDFRRQLAWDPVGHREAVRDGLDTLAWQTEHYGGDPTVFLSLGSAVRRLELDRQGRQPSPAAIAGLLRQLWETALYLEDGGTSLALERLRAAERALQEALERGAEMDELERLMDELQQAMNDYMQAMAEQLRDQQRNGEEMPTLDPENQANTVRPQDLNQMMDQIREMMRNGMKDAAQQMLSQLQQMMENMRAGVMPQMSPDAREAMDMMKDLQDIMRGQQELMDRTFNESNRNGQGRSGEGMGTQPGETDRARRDGSNGMNGDVPSPDAALQEALRRQLGDVMRRFGEMMGDIPQPFGNAEGEMRQSGEALRQGRPDRAVGPQGRAMDQLQSAAEAARNAFMERFTQQNGVGQQMPGEGGAESTDPFGREPSDSFRGAADGNVRVPSGSEMQRSREIRDELRRRSGDRSRPGFELDYYDRLLDQFR
ncbi:TIGR02302 family protein [Marivibrio halodurans]|uniref:TIGR02302 family protein n=1 Tax=Marivibrio halodurans TaxID=2039722 RepID=A0A8J7S8W4_9PROT|nr:TIGR02302 family protein [Marivibrio halodurans]MBP5859014.1 TIGR02302 family protein [Marivibrio halodurans]